MIEQEKVPGVKSAPSLPAAGEHCKVCDATHDLAKCNDHKAWLEGYPRRQCGRPRPKDSELCYAHQRARHWSPPAYQARADREAERLALLNKRTETLLTNELPPTFTDDGTWLPAAPVHDPAAAPVENTVEELAKLAGVLRNAVTNVGERVNQLTSLSVETRAGGEQLRGEVVLWEKLLGHLRMTLVEMEKLDLTDRLVRVEERRADLVAEALFWFLAATARELGFNSHQRAVTEELMRQTVARIVGRATEPVQPTGFAASAALALPAAPSIER